MARSHRPRSYLSAAKKLDLIDQMKSSFNSFRALQGAMGGPSDSTPEADEASFNFTDAICSVLDVT